MMLVTPPELAASPPCTSPSTVPNAHWLTNLRFQTTGQASGPPKVTICIPHWQAELFITLCLRSIRQHSQKYSLEVIVIDNGSHDRSLDYLRSLDWIRLIERPDEVHTNWPDNVFTAWDRGLQEATGEFYVTMHSDVFIRRDGWLDPLLREIERSDRHAASGSWKLEIENPVYAWQKRVVGYAAAKTRAWVGLGKPAEWQLHNYPRDYCAMYRRRVLLTNGLTFRGINGYTGGGYSIARQIWDAGYQTPIFPCVRWRRACFTSRTEPQPSRPRNVCGTPASSGRPSVRSPGSCAATGFKTCKAPRASTALKSLRRLDVQLATAGQLRRCVRR